LTRTDYPSFEASDSSAARSPGKRTFPPHNPADVTAIANAEILDIINPKRRQRTYPRVVKRHFAKYHRIKRPTDHGQHHHDTPKIHIFNIPA